MSWDRGKPQRRSIRLKGYDYSQPGAYFVTICVLHRRSILGEVFDGEMHLSELGSIVYKHWSQVQSHFRNVTIDSFVVMPNHVHSLIMIHEHRRGGVTPPLRPSTLSQIVAYYKYQTTKHINQRFDSVGKPFWQRGFHDRIVRNDKELKEFRKYIFDNPLKWELDEYHPLGGNKA